MSGRRQDPLTLLREIESNSIAAAPSLPQEVEAAVLWSGIGFRLGARNFVSPLGQVLEILPPPTLTLVPKTRAWVRGVANVRGNLITVVDLAGYFGLPPAFLNERARLMVMNVPELRAGLLVTEVMGLRHFDEEVERRDVESTEDPALRPYLTMMFAREDIAWSVFDMKALAESMTFKHVAA